MCVGCENIDFSRSVSILICVQSVYVYVRVRACVCLCLYVSAPISISSNPETIQLWKLCGSAPPVAVHLRGACAAEKISLQHTKKHTPVEMRRLSSRSTEPRTVRYKVIVLCVHQHLWRWWNNGKWRDIRRWHSARSSRVRARDECLLQSDVCLLQSDVCLLQSDVYLLQSDVVLLQSDACLLQSDVCLLQSDVCLLQSDVCLLQGQMCFYSLCLSSLGPQHRSKNKKYIYGTMRWHT